MFHLLSTSQALGRGGINEASDAQLGRSWRHLLSLGVGVKRKKERERESESRTAF